MGGCHGEPAAQEYFRITLDRDGTVSTLWIFDVEATEEIVTHKNGRIKTHTTHADFRMGGPYTPAGEFAATTVTEAPDGTLDFGAAGSFRFVHYASDGDPMMVELDESPEQFKLAITPTPNSDTPFQVAGAG